jgi:hypothetical protein
MSFSCYGECAKSCHLFDFEPYELKIRTILSEGYNHCYEGGKYKTIMSDAYIPHMT